MNCDPAPSDERVSLKDPSSAVITLEIYSQEIQEFRTSDRYGNLFNKIHKWTSFFSEGGGSAYQVHDFGYAIPP